jgi:hypothetical protein
MLVVSRNIGSHQYAVREALCPLKACSLGVMRSSDPQQSRTLHRWDRGDAGIMLGSGPLDMHRTFTDDEAKRLIR